MSIRYKVDNARGVIVENFERRGWVRAESEEDDWNVYWAGVHVVRQIFSLDSGIRLNDTQLINHFPNHSELTRKDLMYKNIKRYRRDLEKERNPLAEKDERGIYTMLDFVPNTFSLPSDYAMFVEEYKRRPNSVWIMKPTNRAQGVGIFLIHKISQIKKWSRSDKWVGPSVGGVGGGVTPSGAQGNPTSSSSLNYIVQRYIDNPLLVGGKKFDLRIYRPLKAYMFKEGFGRFCAEEYNDDLDALDNEMAHLTNVSVQKHGEDYSENHGQKWAIKSLFLYLESTRGKQATDRCMEEIKLLIIHSLRAVQNVMVNDKHCFECYGYDVLIDDTLRPWLIEVNASPSLSATTRSDRAMKLSLINDVLEIIVPPNLLDPGRGMAPKDYNVAPRRLGSFEVLFDEAAEVELDTQDGPASSRSRSQYPRGTSGSGTLLSSGRPGTAPSGVPHHPAGGSLSAAGSGQGTGSGPRWMPSTGVGGRSSRS